MLIGWIFCCKRTGHFWFCGIHMKLRNGSFLITCIFIFTDILIFIYWLFRVQLLQIFHIRHIDIEKQIGSYFRFLLQAFFVLQAIVQAFDVLLIFGIRQHSMCILYTWMVTTLYLRIFICTVLGIIIAFAYAVNGFWNIALGWFLIEISLKAFMLYSLFIIYNFYSILGERTTANDPTANELNSNEPVCTSVRTGSVDDDGTMNSDDSTTRPETIMLYQCSSHATGHPSQMRRKSSLMDASNIGTEEWSNVEHSGSLSRTETLLNIQMLDSSSTSYDH